MLTITLTGVTDDVLEVTETIDLSFDDNLAVEPFEGYNSMTFPLSSSGTLQDNEGIGKDCSTLDGELTMTNCMFCKFGLQCKPHSFCVHKQCKEPARTYTMRL